jgi:DNA invertase Pin-like site-specific DNA recombinase
MTKVFAYLRVSGKGQIDGDGFTRQLEAIRTYALAHNIKIMRVFREEGVSGTKELENRPALQELLSALEDGDVRVMMVEKLDRLARDLMVQETIIGDLRKRRYELVSVAEPDLCSDDPSRKLVRQMFGAIAEYEKSMVVLKLRGARQRMRVRTGRCEGIKPYGHTAEESQILGRMRKLRSGGMAVDTIAQTLNDDGIRTRSGGDWYGATVNKIVKREPSPNVAQYAHNT